MKKSHNKASIPERKKPRSEKSGVQILKFLIDFPMAILRENISAAENI